MKKIFAITTKTLYIAVTFIVIALAILFVGTKVDLLGYEIKVVKSGSMEPAIQTGGIVIVSSEKSSTYKVGDIVTFNTDSTGSVPVTHRVVEAEGAGRSAIYHTKGDANHESDPKPVRGFDVIGKVVLTIPYLGYVIDFVRTPVGFVALIAIPALLIVFEEILKIWRELRKLSVTTKHDEAVVESQEIHSHE